MRAPFSHKYLLSRLNYNPKTGIWIRLAHYKGYAGHRMPSGYLRIRIGKSRYLAHVLAWFYITKKWPSQIVDHKDNDKTNIKWSNLRLATCMQNRVNSKCRIDNKNKLKGVLHSSKNSWQAVVTVRKKRIYLGSFNTPHKAHAAYCRASKRYFGKFARGA